jgi:hypothetical protein
MDGKIWQPGGKNWYTKSMITRSTILQHVIEPEQGNLRSDLAEFIRSLDFAPSDQARYAQLAERAQSGGLTLEEKTELDDFLNVNDFLTIVQAKARTSLAQHTPGS